MTVKSCRGYFQISKHLGAISTFQTESEIWPFAESAFPQAAGTPVSASAKGVAGRSMNFLILLFNHIFMIPGHSRQSQKLPTSVQACTRDVRYELRCLRCSNFYVSPRYIWTLSMMFVEQRGIWIAFEFAMFEMFSLCINLSGLKIILNINSHREIMQPAFPPPCTLE